jgi:hypothetical protein
MSVYEIIKAALMARHPLLIVRKGKPRYVCAHVLGTKIDNKAGRSRQNCLFYQWAGESEKGLGPDGSSLNWRCMHVDEIESAEILKNEPWHTVKGLPTQVSFCVDVVDAKVWL